MEEGRGKGGEGKRIIEREHLEISLFDLSGPGLGRTRIHRPRLNLHRSVRKALIPHNETDNLNAEQFPRLLYMKKLHIIRNRPVLFSLNDQLSGSRKLVFSQESNFHLGIESHARSHGHQCSINPLGKEKKKLMFLFFFFFTRCGKYGNLWNLCILLMY